MKWVQKVEQYHIWQDERGYYGCSLDKDKPPKHCGYKYAWALMHLKGIYKNWINY